MLLSRSLSARGCSCPRCGATSLKSRKLPHPLLLHWTLNPGLVLNELLLGQRVASLQLICESCPGPQRERTFVPCPSCQVVHDERVWAGANAFGNWLGLICPTCSKRIPCLWNVVSLGVLAITAPLWYLPHLYYFRDRLTVHHLSPHAAPVRRVTWWHIGLVYGSLMWMGMALAPAIAGAISGHGFRWRDLMIGTLVWYFAGLVLGLLMSFATSRRSERPQRGT